MAKQGKLIYVGLQGSKREIFRPVAEPTRESHGDQYAAVIGPFRTVRGAEFMRDNGAGNPHCQCVADAERIAAGYAYDIALGKWIRKTVAA